MYYILPSLLNSTFRTFTFGVCLTHFIHIIYDNMCNTYFYDHIFLKTKGTNNNNEL